MTPKEAIEGANGQWFRPVTWRGTGQAVSLAGTELELWHEPTHWPFVASKDDLCCDWEIVSPETVEAERSSINP